MTVLANPEIIHNNQTLAWIYKELDFPSTNDFTFTLGCAVLFLMLCSTISNVIAIWIICHFTRAWEHNISKRLLTHYIYQPYSKFLNHNTSSLVKNITSEVHSVISGVYIPGAHIFARTLVALLIVFFLIAVDPFLAMVLFLLFGSTYFAIYRWTSDLNELPRSKLTGYPS